MEGSYVVNPLDILIVSIIFGGMFFGSKNGIFKVSTRIISIVLSVIFGFRFRKLTESIFLDHLNIHMSPEGMALVSFLAAFVIVYIVVSTILTWLTGNLKKINVGIDTALGAAFGGLTATFVLSILLFVLSYVGFPSPENAKGSFTYPYVRGFAKYSLGLVPKALNTVNNQIQRYGGPGGLQEPSPNNQEPEERPSSKPRNIR